jgi:general stress protein YciG
MIKAICPSIRNVHLRSGFQHVSVASMIRFRSKLGWVQYECQWLVQEEVKIMADEKGKMTVSEAGRKGGKTTAKKYGREFYEEIGHKGGQKVKELIERGKQVNR